MPRPNWLQVRNAEPGSSGPVELLIYDQIGTDWFGNPGVNARWFVEDLRSIPADREIVVGINSPGGNVWDGLAIYHNLAMRRARVTVRVDGMAGSICSIIALAGRELIMPKSALMMIHEPYVLLEGNADAMAAASERLDALAVMMANIYAEKTGKSPEKIRELMRAETEFTGLTAHDFGFCDRLTEELAIAACWDATKLPLKRKPVASASTQTLSPGVGGAGEAANPPAASTNQPSNTDMTRHRIPLLLLDSSPGGAAGGGTAVAPAASGAEAGVASVETALKAERNRLKDIRALYDQHRCQAVDTNGMVLQAYLDDGKRTVADMQSWILTNRYATAEPTNLDPRIHNTPEALAAMNPGSGAIVPPQFRGGAMMRLGDLLVNNAAYKAAIKSGNSADKRRVSMELPLLSPRAATLATGSLTSFERPPGIILLEQQPLTVAALLAQGQTTAQVIRAFRETSYTNAATTVAEEGQKPEASFALEEVDFPVEKIAVLGRVTDEMFADFPVTRDYVNSRLIFMAQAKEDNLLLNGDGSTPNIRGILNTSGINTVSGASGAPADAIHRAITKVRFTGFFEPNGVILNPLDWENIKLTKDGNGQYYGGGPFMAPYGAGEYKIVGMIWGLPVVVTTAIAQGTALVGSFNLGAQIWRREGVRIDSTNSDGDDFKYNRICIRVESRAALAVYRPLAFSTVTGIPLVGQ